MILIHASTTKEILVKSKCSYVPCFIAVIDSSCSDIDSATKEILIKYRYKKIVQENSYSGKQNQGNISKVQLV